MRVARKSLRNTLEKFKKKVPVPIPVYHSDLLKGRTAIVTGGTSGIGLEIARSFIRSGASVVITGRNEDRIKQAVESVKQSNRECEGLIFGAVLDSSAIASFEAAFEGIKAKLGGKKIDILVNNAGVLNGGRFSEIRESDFDAVIDTNLKGVYFLSQLVSRYMVENKIEGNILNIASSSSLRPASSPYTLSKWGIRGLTLGLAKTLAPHGIVVNGIAPGPTATPMLVTSKDNIAHHGIPAQRYAAPEEIANFSVIMASSMGRSIMGDIVYMTGGAGNLTFDDIEYNF